jgi:acetyltransferase-like isoleucine patch superfamily enzyme
LIINMDADLYSSTSYVLNFLLPFIKPGTIIYFDEMNHVDHEPRAFTEIMKRGLMFKPLAADKSLAHVSFECISVPNC